MAVVVGIDLGTTFTVVAASSAEGPQVIGSGRAAKIPSVVAFSADGPVVGWAAVALGRHNPDAVVRSVKRHMGSPWTFAAAGRRWSAVELSALIVAEAARVAREFSGADEVAAVVTVPAYFSSPQRTATADAVQAAGVTLLGMVNEPTAAALAYGMADPGQAPRTVVVCDVGGGTTDVSVLRAAGADVQVTSVAGDNRLGGDDWDAALRNYLADEFSREHMVDLAGDAAAWGRLLAVSSEVKALLSVRDTVPVPWADVLGSPFPSGKVSRRDFDKVSAHLVDRVEAVVRSACDGAGLAAANADVMLLVGGATQTPALLDRLERLAGDAQRVRRQVDAADAVALGAAVSAGSASGVSAAVKVRDVTPLTLGVETCDGLMEQVVRRNTPVPVSVVRTFTTESDNQSSVLVQVFQGERPVAALNRRLASVELSAIPPAPGGVPEIEVMFDIDASGRVSVSVSEVSSGVSARVAAARAVWLDSAALAKALSEAADNAGADGLLASRLRSQRRTAALLGSAAARVHELDAEVAAAASALEAASVGGNLMLVDLAAVKLEELLADRDS